MNTFFRSCLVAALATLSLVTAGAGERTAAVEQPGSKSHDRTTSIAVAARAKPDTFADTFVSTTSECDVRGGDERAATLALRDARIARMDFGNANSLDASTGVAEDEDQGSVVPAIYTWTPATRFVFYRNVGKWM